MKFAQLFHPKKIVSKIKKWYQEYQSFRHLRDTLQKNKALFNSKKGGTCFILGNGPSINNQNLTLLADEETFVMNNFWRHPQYKVICPKYLVAGDLSSYIQNLRPVEAWGANYIAGVDLPDSDAVISQVLDTKLILNSVAKNFIEQNKLFSKNQVYYVLEQGPMDDNLCFNVDLAKPIPFPKNSVILALISALYVGFEIIYLLGCDHDFLAYPAKKAPVGFKRFYEPTVDPSAYKESASYEEMVGSGLRLFRNYRLLKEKAAQLYPQATIYNATPNSFLDVFPMVNFEDIKLNNK